MSTVTTKDGTEIYYKDWGTGQPVVFSHGWPLSSEAWAGQMLFLAQHGYRAIAHDRRGHGRSSQTSSGNDMNTYADDLAAVIDHLDLKNAVLVGHSTGGGEVTRYVGRYGTKRVDKVVLIAAVPPLLLKTDSESGGTSDRSVRWLARQSRQGSLAVLQRLRDYVLRRKSRRSQGIAGNARPVLAVEHAGQFEESYECIKAFSETDFTEDLKKFDVPALVLHGEDDQVVPVKDSAKKSAKLIPNATEIYYPGGAHGITATQPDRVNADLLEFAKKAYKTFKAG